MATARLTKGKIELQVPYCDRNKANAIPGARWIPKARLWRYIATPEVWACILAAWPGTSLQGGGALTEAIAKRHKAERYQNPEYDVPPTYEFHTRPWRHQVRATLFGIQMDAALMHCAMGAGKTKITLDVCRARGHKRVLLICPKGVLPVWRHEIRKHAPKGFAYLPLPSQKSVAKRTAFMLAKLALYTARKSETCLIVAVNYDAVWRPPLDDAVLGMNWDCLVMDESHRIKAHNSRCSKFCAKINAGHKLALTGTPLPHCPLDIFGQYRTLDTGIFGGSFVRFRGRYCVMGGYEGHQITSWQRQAEMRRRIDKLRLFVPREALNLPPLQTLERYCELEPAARKSYKELESEFITEVHDGVVTASNALVKLLRLQQIASGWVRLDDDGGDAQISTAKRGALAELLEDIGAQERVVVFALFKRDLESIAAVCEKMGRTYCQVSGSINQYEEWKRNKGLSTIGVQLRAGEGIDLTEASYAIFFSMGYSLGAYEQCVARIYRPGQKAAQVRVYHLLAEKTVDEKVLKALIARKDVVTALLEEAASCEDDDALDYDDDVELTF